MFRFFPKPAGTGRKPCAWAAACVLAALSVATACNPQLKETSMTPEDAKFFEMDLDAEDAHSELSPEFANPGAHGILIAAPKRAPFVRRKPAEKRGRFMVLPVLCTVSVNFTGTPVKKPKMFRVENTLTGERHEGAVVSLEEGLVVPPPSKGFIAAVRRGRVRKGILPLQPAGLRGSARQARNLRDQDGVSRNGAQHGDRRGLRAAGFLFLRVVPPRLTGRIRSPQSDCHRSKRHDRIAVHHARIRTMTPHEDYCEYPPGFSHADHPQRYRDMG